MCGIVGYLGPREPKDIILKGFARSSTAVTTAPASPSSTKANSAACARRES